MTLRHIGWSKLVVVGAVVLAVILSVGVAQASNMGFKMNKVIQPLGSPAPKGVNQVALPYKNPYVNAQDVCNALGLSNVAPAGKVTQSDANTGGTSSHTCGNAAPFNLVQRVGVTVTNNTAAGGIIVGSHQANPPGSITLYPLATPAPKGVNLFPVPYHTTAINAQDLCVDLGLPAGASIKSLDAATGGTSSHTCGNAAPFGLTLGLAVQVTFSGAIINVPAGHPAHF
jgi:hypothetical protein